MHDATAKHMVQVLLYSDAMVGSADLMLRSVSGNLPKELQSPASVGRKAKSSLS